MNKLYENEIFGKPTIGSLIKSYVNYLHSYKYVSIRL